MKRSNNDDERYMVRGESREILAAMCPETSYYLSQDIRYTGVDNVVVNLYFGCTIPLLALVRRYPNVEYKPQRFSAAIVRSGRPFPSTALVFRTGSAMIVGTPHIDISRFAMQCYRKMLSAQGHVTDCLDFRMVNVVCTSHMKHCVHLPRLATKIPDECVYEPSLFPGLVCPMGANSLPGLGPDRRILALVFDGGATVVMGIHGSDELTLVMERLLPFIRECRITPAELAAVKRERAESDLAAASTSRVAGDARSSGVDPTAGGSASGERVGRTRGGLGGVKDAAKLHKMLAKVDITSSNCVKDLMELFKNFKNGTVEDPAPDTEHVVTDPAVSTDASSLESANEGALAPILSEKRKAQGGAPRKRAPKKPRIPKHGSRI